jgi:hypothetical protein
MESKMSIYLTSEETNKLLDKELDKVYENQVKKKLLNLVKFIFHQVI